MRRAHLLRAAPLLLACALAATAAAEDWGTLAPREKLLHHAPVWFLHPDEQVLPVPVEALEGESTLNVQEGAARCAIHALGRGDLERLGTTDFWETRERELEDPAACAKQGHDAETARKLRRKALDLVRAAGTIVRERDLRETVDLSIDLVAVDVAGFRERDAGAHRHVAPGEQALRVPQTGAGSVCYAHLVEDVRLPSSLGNRGGEPRNRQRRRPVVRLGRRYDVAYYFLFFPYNDSTNVHEGDWDAAVAVAHPLPDATPERPVVAAFFSHESSIVLRLQPGGEGLPTEAYLASYAEWVGGPESGWNERSVLAFGEGHPLLYVSRGSHAAYPIPGFTATGVEIVLQLLVRKIERRVPFGFDAHPLGLRYLSATPAWPPQEVPGAPFEVRTEGAAFENVAPTPTCRLVALEHGSPGWTAFPGRFGEASLFEGWSGPHGFLRNERVVRADDTAPLARWVQDAVHPLDTVEVGGFGGRLVHLPSTAVLRPHPMRR